MTIPSTHLSLLQALGEEGRREDAWAVFQAGYRDVILGWGQRYGLDLHAAEDLTQEILIKLLEALPRHEHNPDRGRFRSWLKTVVRNVLADRRRRQRRRLEPGGWAARPPWSGWVTSRAPRPWRSSASPSSAGRRRGRPRCSIGSAPGGAGELGGLLPEDDRAAAGRGSRRGAGPQRRRGLQGGRTHQADGDPGVPR